MYHKKHRGAMGITPNIFYGDRLPSVSLSVSASMLTSASASAGHLRSPAELCLSIVANKGRRCYPTSEERQHPEAVAGGDAERYQSEGRGCASGCGDSW